VVEFNTRVAAEFMFSSLFLEDVYVEGHTKISLERARKSGKNKLSEKMAFQDQ